MKSLAERLVCVVEPRTSVQEHTAPILDTLRVWNAAAADNSLEDALPAVWKSLLSSEGKHNRTQTVVRLFLCCTPAAVPAVFLSIFKFCKEQRVVFHQSALFKGPFLGLQSMSGAAQDASVVYREVSQAIVEKVAKYDAKNNDVDSLLESLVLVESSAESSYAEAAEKVGQVAADLLFKKHSLSTHILQTLAKFSPVNASVAATHLFTTMEENRSSWLWKELLSSQGGLSLLITAANHPPWANDDFVGSILSRSYTTNEPTTLMKKIWSISTNRKALYRLMNTAISASVRRTVTQDAAEATSSLLELFAEDIAAQSAPISAIYPCVVDVMSRDVRALEHIARAALRPRGASGRAAGVLLAVASHAIIALQTPQDLTQELTDAFQALLGSDVAARSSLCATASLLVWHEELCHSKSDHTSADRLLELLIRNAQLQPLFQEAFAQKMQSVMSPQKSPGQEAGRMARSLFTLLSSHAHTPCGSVARRALRDARVFAAACAVLRAATHAGLSAGFAPECDSLARAAVGAALVHSDHHTTRSLAANVLAVHVLLRGLPSDSADVIHEAVVRHGDPAAALLAPVVASGRGETGGPNAQGAAALLSLVVCASWSVENESSTTPRDACLAALRLLCSAAVTAAEPHDRQRALVLICAWLQASPAAATAAVRQDTDTMRALHVALASSRDSVIQKHLDTAQAEWFARDVLAAVPREEAARSAGAVGEESMVSAAIALAAACETVTSSPPLE